MSTSAVGCTMAHCLNYIQASVQDLNNRMIEGIRLTKIIQDVVKGMGGLETQVEKLEKERDNNAKSSPQHVTLSSPLLDIKQHVLVEAKLFVNLYSTILERIEPLKKRQVAINRATFMIYHVPSVCLEELKAVTELESVISDIGEVILLKLRWGLALEDVGASKYKRLLKLGLRFTIDDVVYEDAVKSPKRVGGLVNALQNVIPSLANPSIAGITAMKFISSMRTGRKADIARFQSVVDKFYEDNGSAFNAVVQSCHNYLTKHLWDMDFVQAFLSADSAEMKQRVLSERLLTLVKAYAPTTGVDVPASFIQAHTSLQAAVNDFSNNTKWLAMIVGGGTLASVLSWYFLNSRSVPKPSWSKLPNYLMVRFELLRRDVKALGCSTALEKLKACRDDLSEMRASLDSMMNEERCCSTCFEPLYGADVCLTEDKSKTLAAGDDQACQAHHVSHEHCLREWFGRNLETAAEQRSRYTCPDCRRAVRRLVSITPIPFWIPKVPGVEDAGGSVTTWCQCAPIAHDLEDITVVDDYSV